MNIQTNRRLFLTGLTSLAVAAPSIVRASSLMDIKGVLLDPKILAFRHPVGGVDYWWRSGIPRMHPQWRKDFDHLGCNGLTYAIKRESEIASLVWDKPATKAMYIEWRDTLC